MAIKTAIQSYITSKLTGLGLVKTTRSEHENLLFNNPSSILNELYKTALISDIPATTNVLTVFNSDWVYLINIKKQGGNVTISGSIRNVSGLPLNGQVAIITNSEYYQNTPVIYASGYSNTTFDNIRMQVSGNIISLVSQLLNNEEVRFNFSYPCGQ